MKTRKLTAILLALCMLLSLSISAFAADDAVASGTIPDSKITWNLDYKGWLTISGSGDCSAFASKDDQPWAEYRSQITQVWFDGMESLAIPDLAYWFEDCTNLTTAEIPSTTPVIGRHAFYNCPLLAKLSIYYGEHTLDSIARMRSGAKPTTAIRSMLRTSLDTRILLCLSTIMTGQHPIEATDISTIFTVCIRTQMPPPQAASRKRLHKFPPVRPPALSAPAQAVSSIPCRALTSSRRIRQEVISSITSATSAIMFRIYGLMCIKIMVPAHMVRGLARTAEAIHGFWTMKMMPLAHETATGNIAAIADRASAKPSTQPVTAIPMEAGRNIPAVSTGAKPIAGTAAIRITNTPATA